MWCREVADIRLVDGSGILQSVRIRANKGRAMASGAIPPYGWGGILGRCAT
jgi:hypothetical protein